MAKVYFGLGSNIGNREENIQTAVRLLEERIGELISLSAFHVTKPEGFESENLFINAVCCISSRFAPLEILDKTEEIEQQMGRITKSLNGAYKDRVIDIDLLLYDDLVFSNERLIIPHPYMTQRRFVMEPLAEIAPTVIIPSTNCSIAEIYKKLLIYKEQ